MIMYQEFYLSALPWIVSLSDHNLLILLHKKLNVKNAFL